MSSSVLLALGPTWMSVWLTPVWIIGMGALMGLVVLVVAWGLIAIVSRRAAAGAWATVQEWPLWWIICTTAVLAAFGAVGWLFAGDSRDILNSLWRYPSLVLGDEGQTFEIPAPQATAADGVVALGEDEHEIDVAFLGRELREIQIQSNQNVEVAPQPYVGQTTPALRVIAGEQFVWQKKPKGLNPFPDGLVEKLYVRNLGDGPAQLQIAVIARPEHSEAIAAPVTALIILVVVAAYFAQRLLLPKVSAVALSTAKSEMSQPLFLILLALGLAVLWLFIFIPYYTLGEDIKMLKNTGLPLIKWFCIFFAIWAASRSINDEIEDRTALTVLSKPISRWQFILGKYAGIMWATGVLFTILSVWFLLVCVAYKPVYDSREGAESDVIWQMAHYEVVQTAPGLALAFMEIGVLAAVSVAISTRLPMLANFVICFAIAVLGHLTPLMVQSAVINEAFEPVVFIGRLIATVFPVLENLNIEAAVAGGSEVPLAYLGWAFLYSSLYAIIAMLLALTLFEDRDLA